MYELAGAIYRTLFFSTYVGGWRLCLSFLRRSEVSVNKKLLTNKQAVYVQLESKTMDQQESVFIEAEGYLYERSGIFYLRYKETIEQSGTWLNTWIIDKKRVKLQRNGSTRMDQRYELGQRTIGTYHTAHGTFTMKTTTDHIQFSPPSQTQESLIHAEGRLILHYHLVLNDEDLGHFKVNIQLVVKET